MGLETWNIKEKTQFLHDQVSEKHEETKKRERERERDEQRETNQKNVLGQVRKSLRGAQRERLSYQIVSLPSMEKCVIVDAQENIQ